MLKLFRKFKFYSNLAGMYAPVHGNITVCTHCPYNSNLALNATTGFDEIISDPDNNYRLV